jgi:hypothetical protein
MTEARRIYWKNRYESLKARGRCVACGKAAKERGLRCEDCKIKATGASKKWQRKRRDGARSELERLRAEVVRLTALLEAKRAIAEAETGVGEAIGRECG